MATVTRSIAAGVVEALEDGPSGAVPSPFPALHRQRDLESNSSAALQVLHRDTDIANQQPRLRPPIGPALMEGMRALHEVQFSAIDALVVVLEPTFPQLRQNIQLYRPEASALSSSSSTLYAPSVSTQLQLIVANISSSAPNPEPNVLPPDPQSLADISRLITTPHVSASISQADVQLIQQILSLLAHASTLSERPDLSDRIIHSPHSPSLPGRELADFRQALARVLQTSALDDLSTTDANVSDPVLAVKLSLASTHLGNAALSLIHELTSRIKQSRTSTIYRPSYDSDLPPEYEYDPPAYGFPLLDDESSGKIRHVQSAPDLGRTLHRSSTSATAEKMQLELNEVTDAIERMYTVTPQIGGQRVELAISKRQELELARIMGSVERLGNRLDAQRAQGRPLVRSIEADSTKETTRKGKGRADDTSDLEDFLEILSKAQRPRLPDQRVTVSAELSSRLRGMENAKARESNNHEVFFSRLQRSVEKGRLQSQDAVFSPTKSAVQEKVALLTLPEFIHESRNSPGTASTMSEQHSHPSTDYTTPPLSRQASKSSLRSGLVLKHKRSFFGTRPRSHSVPALKASDDVTSSKNAHRSSSEPLILQYVAEHQENLRLVSVQITLPDDFSASQQWSVTFVESGSIETATSLNIHLDPKDPPSSVELPVPVLTSGKNSLVTRVIGDRLEIKLNTPPSEFQTDDHPLLDAAHLNNLQPASFICSSCSLPMIQCRIEDNKYALAFADLPSEYWTELVESWMCHSEQKLSDDVVKQSKGGARGAQPSQAQVLVGGSYLLVDASAVKDGNFRVLPETKNYVDWRPIRCICGAALGARQLDAGNLSSTYRFAKYAVRPISASSSYEKPPPLSAYVVADMMEIVQAHASYRFVLRDEEDEKVRMLIWLFNPSVRISHSVSRAFALSKTGTNHAAKVMFKLVGPQESLPVENIAASHPDFVAAEHLFYPISVCHSLAVLLQNSNLAYPPSSRMMGALNLGWLHRA